MVGVGQLDQRYGAQTSDAPALAKAGLGVVEELEQVDEQREVHGAFREGEAGGVPVDGASQPLLPDPVEHLPRGIEAREVHPASDQWSSDATRAHADLEHGSGPRAPELDGDPVEGIRGLGDRHAFRETPSRILRARPPAAGRERARSRWGGRGTRRILWAESFAVPSSSRSTRRPCAGRPGGPVRAEFLPGDRDAAGAPIMIRLCITSQTPPIRPLPGARQHGRARWRLGTDYVPNVGGVVPMMRALLREAVGKWVAPNPRWVALSAAGLPPMVRTDDGYLLETLPLDDATRAAYGRFKESIWRSFHTPLEYHFPIADYVAFAEYNFRTAVRLLERAAEYDLVYVNDFQQVLVGGLVGSAAPALLRWHIPVDLKGYPEPVRRFFLKSMEGFDGIVVSTRAGLEELIRAGFHGRAFQVYPYLDPATQRTATPSEVAEFRERHGIAPSEPIVLSVARMDPVKRQDLLLDAFVRVHRHHPRARLVIVGGGSFSTRSLRSGRGGNPAERWLDRLRHRVREHRLERAVVFTGAVSEAELQVAYSAAQVFVHPAPWEGFGLVGIEAWFHDLPILVSQGAGIAELVDDEVNGLTFPPESVPILGQHLDRLLAHPELARRMGEVGALTARRCTVQRAAPRLQEIFERAIQLYAFSGLREGPDLGARLR